MDTLYTEFERALKESRLLREELLRGRYPRPIQDWTSTDGFHVFVGPQSPLRKERE